MKLLLLGDFHKHLSSSDAFRIYDGQQVPILMRYNTELALIAEREVEIADTYLNGTRFIVRKGDPVWLQYTGTLSERNPCANDFVLHCQGEYHYYTPILNLIPPSAPHGRLSDPYHFDAERQIRNIEAILAGKQESRFAYNKRQVELVRSQLPTADFWIDSPSSDGRMGLNTNHVQVKDGLYYLRQTFAEGGINDEALASYMCANAMYIIEPTDSASERNKKWFDNYNANQEILINQYHNT